MLISKNIYVNKRRTSMRLDEENWAALFDICKSENITLNELLSLIDNNKGKTGFSIATRVFITSYLRNIIKQLPKKNKINNDNAEIINLLSVIYKDNLK